MEDLLGGWSNEISDVDYERIVDLLVEFDEMDFCPTTTCPFPHNYAMEWKKKLLEAVDKLNFERKDAINECNKVYEDLSKEIERLENEKEEIRLFNLALENGEIDMSIESEMAKSFYNSIIQIFEQNGATNFFTTTVDIEGKKGRYAFTIEKVGGQTVAEKLAEQKAEIERLTEYAEMFERGEIGSPITMDKILALEKDKIELQKQVDELKEENKELYKENTTLIAGSILERKDIAKDTAKEILKWLKAEVIMTEIPHGSEPCEEDVEAVMWWKIEEHFKKKYGVEVE